MAATKTAPKRRARGWERKRANRDTRQEILDAAAVAWSNDGFEGASLAEIARDVGIKAPSLYNHFKSKNQILYTFLKEHGDAFILELEESQSSVGSDPKERLASFLKTHIMFEIECLEVMPLVNSFFEGRPGFMKALKPSQRKTVMDYQRRAIEILQDILKEGEKANQFRYDDLTTASFALLGLVENVVYWFKPGGRLGADRVAQQLADIGIASVSIK